MPLDLIAHGVILTAGAKALPLAFAKTGGVVQGVAATKGGLLAATKAKLTGCSTTFTSKGKILKDIKKVEHELEDMDKESLMMPCAFASPMTLFTGNKKQKAKTNETRKVRRSQEADRREGYNSFL